MPAPKMLTRDASSVHCPLPRLSPAADSPRNRLCGTRRLLNASFTTNQCLHGLPGCGRVHGNTSIAVVFGGTATMLPPDWLSCCTWVSRLASSSVQGFLKSAVPEIVGRVRQLRSGGRRTRHLTGLVVDPHHADELAWRRERRRVLTLCNVAGRPASVRKRFRKFFTRSNQDSALQSRRSRIGANSEGILPALSLRS